MTEKRKNKSTKAVDIPTRFTDDFLDTMDGRGEVTRTLRQRYGSLTSDQGGLSNLSYMKQSICKRIVHIERLIEKDELTMAHGGTVDKHAYFAAINCLSGLLSKIGLERRARTVTLKDYLNTRSTKPEPDPACQVTPQPKEDDR
jgi:hypothetical protein